jgi:hypothetical protein
MIRLHSINGGQKKSVSDWRRTAPGNPRTPKGTARLLLPGAFLMPIGTQLFAPFMFINFAFTTFF